MNKDVLEETLMTQEFQRFVTNLEPEFRRAKLEGVEHLVVPTVMMVEGVFAGNQGPVYYSENQLKKACPGWNHKPVVVYHPKMNGQFISACDPDVLNSRKIGLMLNTAFDKKQRTEVWANPKSLEAIDPRILEAIENKEPMEISNGLFYDPDKTPGEFGGKKFKMSALNHQGDHLAILPDKVGACSIADGAGLCVVNEAFTDWEGLLINREFAQTRRKELAKSGLAMPDGSFPIVTNSDLASAIKAVDRAAEPAAAKRHVIKRAREMGMMNSLSEEWQMTAKDLESLLTVNELSYAEKMCAVRDLLATARGEPGKYWDGYVIDLYDSTVIFQDRGGIMYSVGYKTKANDQLVLVGKPTEVVRVSEYRTASDGSAVVNELSTTEGEPAMDKMMHIDALIAANAGWTEADREPLMAMNEKVLEKIKVPEKAPPAPPVAPPTPEPNPGNKKLTLNELANQLDDEGRDTLQELLGSYTTEKATLVKTITANANNAFSEPELNLMKVPMLRKLAKTAGITQQNGQQFVGNQDAIVTLLQQLGVPMNLVNNGGPNYVGPGGPGPITVNIDTDVLKQPKMEFGDEAAPVKK